MKYGYVKYPIWQAVQLSIIRFELCLRTLKHLEVLQHLKVAALSTPDLPGFAGHYLTAHATGWQYPTVLSCVSSAIVKV